MYIDASPGIEDIRQHKGNKERYIEHHLQRKLAGAAVGQGQ